MIINIAKINFAGTTEGGGGGECYVLPQTVASSNEDLTYDIAEWGSGYAGFNPVTVKGYDVDREYIALNGILGGYNQVGILRIDNGVVNGYIKSAMNNFKQLDSASGQVLVPDFWGDVSELQLFQESVEDGIDVWFVPDYLKHLRVVMSGLSQSSYYRLLHKENSDELVEFDYVNIDGYNYDTLDEICGADVQIVGSVSNIGRIVTPDHYGQYGYVINLQNTNLTLESARNIINSIGDIKSIYSGGALIYFPEDTAKQLTEEEIGIATSKGWSVYIPFNPPVIEPGAPSSLVGKSYLLTDGTYINFGYDEETGYNTMELWGSPMNCSYDEETRNGNGEWGIWFRISADGLTYEDSWGMTATLVQ